MSKIQRYDRYFDEGMIDRANGEYVKFTDHEADKQATAELERLRGFEEAVKMIYEARLADATARIEALKDTGNGYEELLNPVDIHNEAIDDCLAALNQQPQTGRHEADKTAQLERLEVLADKFALVVDTRLAWITQDGIRSALSEALREYRRGRKSG